ncbi:MAG: ABC transporter permease [Bacteroidia bacterium]|nr:ABC transporter permease [Bacteroidia bacterium]
MVRFGLRLALESIGILFLSFTLIFLLLRGLGDPAQMLLGQRSDQVSMAAIRAQLHLDAPLWKQYLYAWADWLPYREGRWQIPSLGTSYQYGRPVMELYLERFPATAILAISGLFLGFLLGVLLGLRQAIRPSWLLERGMLAILALPGYVIGILLVVLLAIKAGPWTGFPPHGYIREFDLIKEAFVWRWRAWVLPALALSLRPAAHLFFLTYTQAQELLWSDFVRTARAKGKPTSRILLLDVGRNLLPTIAVSLSQWLAGLFTGAVFIEELFDWPGVGKLLFSAMASSDFPLLMGISQLSTLLFILLHAAGEIISRWADPRLRTLAQ